MEQKEYFCHARTQLIPKHFSEIILLPQQHSGGLNGKEYSDYTCLMVSIISYSLFDSEVDRDNISCEKWQCTFSRTTTYGGHGGVFIQLT